MRFFTAASSSGAKASADAESTLVSEFLTRIMPSLPCSISSRSPWLASRGKTIVTGTFNLMEITCSKMVHIRVKYRGLSHVSSKAKTFPMRAKFFSKTSSRSSAPVFSPCKMRYWLFTKKHIKRNTSSAQPSPLTSCQCPNASRMMLNLYPQVQDRKWVQRPRCLREIVSTSAQPGFPSRGQRHAAPRARPPKKKASFKS
mmetsp:Transcript_87533/g.282838  ORF Transcript_87533/g.282838 Transcript_87533/m.282838 type:complete len:200 (-) Transcript_87533:2098-2697(-)